LNQAQIQEAFLKYKQLKEQGVPQNDPELLRIQQLLAGVQRHQLIIKKQQQDRFAQQQAQQQSLQHAGVNGMVNGSQQAPTPPGQPPASTTASASAPGSAVLAPSGSAPPFVGPLDQSQLQLLREQITAFKFMSKNQGVPVRIQQSIFAHRARRQVPQIEQTPPQSTTPAPDTPARATPQTGPEAEVDATLGKAAPKAYQYKTVKSPYEAGQIRFDINYFEHAKRKSQLMVPGVFPTGVDFEQLRVERERAVFNRMSARYAELKSLPGNIAHWDTTQDAVVPDDTLKRKAIIEMKSIALYSKQRALRDQIGRRMMHYDNLAMTTNRSQYRRMKKQSVREARITEKLEKEQRDARKNRERKAHVDFIQAVQNNRAELINSALAQKNKTQKLGRLMFQQHFNIEKEEQKRVERTAKQRLQALKANDEEAYLKLLDQAKDTRITHLLRQTDGFLHQLASSVRAQQRQAAERYDGDVDIPEEESEPEEDEAGESNRSKIDYYAVAHRIKEEVTEQANMLVGGKLKEYQIKGLQWMISLYNNNLNGILADEMGLGKTIQTISLITYLIERKHQNGPYLVIVPLSTLSNWNLEFDKWAPSIAKVVYKGPPNARKVQQEKIRRGEFQVLLTTYEYIIKDRPLLSKIKWFHMIIDEGHRMKNANSKLSATIQQYYNTRFRLILTGTPLQNNLSELWAMLNFVLPTIFKSVKTFDEWFNTPFANTGGQDKMELTEEEQILVIRRLHKVLRPFLLRRLKKDVEKDLPDKTEKIIKCKFSSLQSRLYKQMVTHNKILVNDGKGGKTGARGLSNMIMQLRKLCNHPFVFDEVENQMNPTNTSNDLLWRTAGKFELLDRILPKYQATGHRVLMFFQMTAIMDIMEDYLRYRGVTYLRLDGTTKTEDRSELLKEYNRPDSPYFMFLLSTRAGGLGLNLQTADTVIIYDSDWNPHQDLQAQDRAHRIGQKNEVRILRLIHSNSVEEKILERARFKLSMDGKVIQAGRFDNKSSETDRDAMLRTLLESADMAENQEQEEMDDEELNMILARNDDELVKFHAMDADRAKDPVYGTVPGTKHVPRLMAENELPDIYLSEGNVVDESEDVVLGRGARERNKVKYDDGLTEEQWLMAVDDDDDSPEAAAARKAARKERREQKRLKRMAAGGPDEPSPSGSRASTEEVETPVKKRGRKPGSKNVEKRKVDVDGLVDDEPPAKKRRGPQARSRVVAAPDMAPEVHDSLNKSLRRLYDSLMNLEVEFPEPPEKEEGEDEPPMRLIIGPFVKLPSKRDYGDYYMVTKSPIAMNIIDKKLKKAEYRKLSDLKRDIELLCSNCRNYNDDASLLYADANTIEAFFNKQYQQELSDHPELAELEGSGQNTSAGPSTATGTPQPASSGPTRIKLVSNSNGTSQVNGGSSGLQSDEE
jgi:ATP-dependent helicase STH1/SNF2